MKPSDLTPPKVVTLFADILSTRVQKVSDFVQRNTPIPKDHCCGTPEEIASMALLSLRTMSDAERVEFVRTILPRGFNITFGMGGVETPYGTTAAVMIRFACPKCGNKRCPHNADTRFKCTGSNEPDQIPELDVEDRLGSYRDR